MKTHEKTPVEAGALREQPAPIVAAPDARQLVAATIAEHGLDWPRGMQARLAKQAGCSAANISRLLKQAKADPVPAPSSNGNGHRQGELRVLEPVVAAEPVPTTGPVEVSPVPQTPEVVPAQTPDPLEEIQREDSTGLALAAELGRKPTRAECEAAGLDPSWGLRWHKLRDFTPEQLLEDQRRRAKLQEELQASFAAAEAARLAALPQERRDYIQSRAGGGAYTPEIIDWLASNGYVSGLTWEEVRDGELRFTRAKETQTGGLLICHNPKSRRPHYQLRCDVAPYDEDRGRHAKYLMQTGAGERLAVWDPSGKIGPDGDEIGQARVGTEGFFDAVYCTLVLGIPCMAITAPSHLRVLKLPDHLRVYLGDCDQWMAPDLLPTLVRGCVSKSLKLARLPLVEEHRQAYLGPHRDLPGGAKGGMEELGQAHGIEGARAIVEAAVATAAAPGDYLAWEIGELKELGLRWPEHSVPLTNLISAMADAHPNNQIKRAALKALAVQAFPGLGADTVRAGIKDRLERRQQSDLEERQQRRERAKADALARGEQPEPEIDREEPTSRQLQEWLAYAHTVSWDTLKRVPVVDGNAITDIELTYQLLAQQHGIEAGKSQAADALTFVAKSNPRNPVAEYLESIRGDDTIQLMPRAELMQLFGLAAHDVVSAEMLELGLRGTAARGLEPGVEFDHCPILRSLVQGRGKTKALKALASRPWFDSLGRQEKGMALGSWKVTSKIAGCWILELGEIDSLTRGQHASDVKEWITTNVDTYAEKNEKIAKPHPRPCVPWGTTNEEELLNDDSGSRRFLIIEVVRQIDWLRVAAERDRIWRTALKQLEAGAPIHLDQDTEAGRALLQASEERGLASTFSDPRVPLVLAYLQAVVDAHRSRSMEERLRLARSGQWETVRPEGDAVEMLRLRYTPVGHKDSELLALFVSINDLHDAVGVQPSARDKGSSARLAKVMRTREIADLGWVKGQSKKHGGRGFQLLPPGDGGDGPDSGPDSPGGPDSGMAPITRGPDSDLPMVPIFSGESGSTCEGTFVSQPLTPETHPNSIRRAPPASEKMGTIPDPSVGEGSSAPFENGAHQNGDHEAPAASVFQLEMAAAAPESPKVNPLTVNKPGVNKRKVKAPGVNKRGVETPGVNTPLPPVVAPTPQPYVGPALTGIDYIHRAQDLPDPEGLPLLCGFDLETWNRRTDVWRHKASLFPFLGGEIRLAQICTGSQTLVLDVALIGESAIDWLGVLARDPARTLVGHNLLFEATYLVANGIRPLCQWWDTMLASQTIGGLAGDSLEAVVKHYLGRDLDKTLQTGGTLGWGNRLTAGHLRYAELDSKEVLPLREALLEKLDATGQVEVHRLDCLRISPAADGQDRGLAIDAAALDEIEAAARAEWEPKRAQLHEMLGLPNPPADESQPYRSTELVHPPLVKILGGERLVKSKKKAGEWVDAPSTEKTVLEMFRGVPVVDLLLEVRDLDRTLLEVTQLRRDLEYAGGRTRPGYKLLGANTGRITTRGQIGQGDRGGFLSDTEVWGKTAKKNTPGAPKPGKVPSQIGANFQGLSPRVKRALITGNPDTVLLDIDWASQEIRLQASPQLYNDRGYRRMIFDEIDPHSLMACTLFGLALPADGIVKKGWVVKYQRDAAKPANFSLPYGCAVASLRRALSAAQGKEVSWETARAVYDAWHEFHRETSRQMDRFDPKKPGGGNIYECRSLAGRRVCSWSKAPKPDGTVGRFPIGRTNGANWPIQSSGADMLSETLGELWPALDRFPGTRVIGLVHDAILLEVPRTYAEEVQAIAVGVMTSERLREKFYGDIPLVAEANIGENWLEAHDPPEPPAPATEEVG